DEEMREAIGSIVFLDAFVPESGDSLAAKASQPVREGIAAATEKGETVMKPGSAAVFRVNETDRGWVDAMCTPHPPATFTDKITITGAREHRQEGLYPRQGLPQRPVRRRAGAAQSRRRVAHLRVALRPRRHGRHAGSSNGSARRGSIAALLRARNERTRPK